MSRKLQFSSWCFTRPKTRAAATTPYDDQQRCACSMASAEHLAKVVNVHSQQIARGTLRDDHMHKL